MMFHILIGGLELRLGGAKRTKAPPWRRDCPSCDCACLGKKHGPTVLRLIYAQTIIHVETFCFMIACNVKIYVTTIGGGNVWRRKGIGVNQHLMLKYNNAEHSQ